MKRFQILGADFCEESEDGQWVRFEDAQAEVARLKAEIDDLQLEVVEARELQE